MKIRDFEKIANDLILLFAGYYFCSLFYLIFSFCTSITKKMFMWYKLIFYINFLFLTVLQSKSKFFSAALLNEIGQVVVGLRLVHVYEKVNSIISRTTLLSFQTNTNKFICYLFLRYFLRFVFPLPYTLKRDKSLIAKKHMNF